MDKYKLLKNKVGAILLVAIGIFLVISDNDITFLVFALIMGIPMFFSRQTQWNKEEENKNIVDKS